MKDIISNATRSMITTFYIFFLVSLVMTVMAMIIYMYIREKGWSHIIEGFRTGVIRSRHFRRMFMFLFYMSFLLFCTLFCRNPLINPFCRVLGVWGVYNDNGEIITEQIRNFFMFIPFIPLLFAALGKRVIKKMTFWQSLSKSILYSGILTTAIELAQVVMKVGQFQLSDLVFNTLGGVLGGMIYYIIYKIKHIGETRIRKL